MIKKTLAGILFFLVHFSISAQPYFSDYIKIANRNLISYYFNTDEFMSEWPKEFRHAQGRILIDSKPSDYFTRKTSVAGGNILIDSMEYLGSGDGKFELIRNIKITIDTLNRIYKRTDVAAWGDSLGRYELRYDEKGRLVYISYKFFPGYISNSLNAHHYQIGYDEKSLIKYIVGSMATEMVTESYEPSINLNMKDSIITFHDRDKMQILMIEKKGDILMVMNQVKNDIGIYKYSHEYSQNEKGQVMIYSEYNPEKKYKKEVNSEETYSISGNSTTVTKVDYDNYPKVKSKDKRVITADPARPGYLLYKFYSNGKLNLTIEEE
jgi:hypothetical protein